MKDIDISVIITTYKRKRFFLNRALESVINQTFNNIEIIVVDDNDKNNEYREDIEKYMLQYIDINTITYIKHEYNKGGQVARNTGIEISKGKYIAFLDDDDEWRKEKLVYQFNKIEKDNNLGLVYCFYNAIHDSGKMTYKKVHKRKGWVYNELLINNFIGSTSSPLIRKEYLIDVGLFDVNLKAMQDLDMWLRVAKKYKVDYVNKYLVNYYDHSGERISNNYELKIIGADMILNKYESDIKKRRITLSKYYFYVYYNIYYNCSNFDLARNIVKKSIKIYPLNIKYFWGYIKTCNLYQNIRKIKNKI